MFKILDKVCTPTRATEFSSCIDLYASQKTVIGAGETKIIPLGVKIDIDSILDNILDDIDYILPHCKDMLPEDKVKYFMKTHCFELKCRSSLTLDKDIKKPHYKGLIMANGVGEIDFDYPDELGIILHNPIKSGVAIQVVKNLTQDDNILFLGDVTIEKGDKIAQIKIVEHKSILFNINTNIKRNGGFGSSGIN